MNFWMMLAGAVVFALATMVSWTLLQRYWPDAGAQRLRAPRAIRATLPSRWADRLPPGLLRSLSWLSQWSLPDDKQPDDGLPQFTSMNTPLGRRLMQAGWRSRHAVRIYGGAKTLLLLVLPMLLISAAWTLGLRPMSLTWWAAVLVTAAAGYLIPDLILRQQLGHRQQALFKAFPDALDLLRVCVQAGLGLDAAIERVGREMRLASPVLSEEWRLTGLELRAGASRSQALRHLGERIGLPEIDAMVTMLIQADRFGTRMADALQVHADTLRMQRRLKAEEAATKLPVKLLIPLVFCIFPALLTVLLGPVAISLYNHFSRQA